MSGFSPTSRARELSIIVLLLVLTFGLELNKLLPGAKDSPLFLLITLFTARGVYEILVRLLYWAIGSFEFLLRIYWGKLYLQGFWSYEYTRGGVRYFGIWRFDQGLETIRVVGTGLDQSFLPRTIVRSVSPLIEDQGAYVVVNCRQELESVTTHITPVYSKTTLLLDAPRGLFSSTTTMRATTEVYGGPASGQVHPNVVFHKHRKARSQDDVIEELRGSGKYAAPDSIASVTPPAVLAAGDETVTNSPGSVRS